MEHYDRTAYAAAELFTRRYSTSFGLASRLFSPAIRQDIFAIYGMVRAADEIVDTYDGPDAAGLLAGFEAAVYAALQRGFDTNPLIHAFARTARRCDIGAELVRPFFRSMELDLQPQTYTDALFEEYVYGSAEVVGLLCLKVFCTSEPRLYEELTAGARHLGAAYQKVNFLRDLHADYQRLGRSYFPGINPATLSEADKQQIVTVIRADFAEARPAIRRLPPAARPAVLASYRYYAALLDKLAVTPAEVIRSQRVRLPDARKLLLLSGTFVEHQLRKVKPV